ncbi:hypothetical protein [Propionibacterium freudenreichii]|uniref:hypothetical protein n=2 Tax=Propionibacterium TaxID=1743 RepID=UPI0005A5C3FE|nr:hypothetical protein [Propionibacterium freudenreichii]MDK9627239.1 hypothetical protein [Propionibacterium freudenreichii]CEI29723.1 Predicted signal transduction protein with a C-terminal ATPase domain [Propionibacterium freudenreichii]
MTQQAVMDDSPGGNAPGLSKRNASQVAAASLVAALSNFVLMFVGTRTLSDAAGTEFLAFWSLLTGLFGVISGVQNETTRAVGAVAEGRMRGVRAVWPALIVGGVVAVIVAALAPVIAHRVVPLSASTAVPALVVIAVAYAAYVTLVGSFGGRGWWPHYAGLLCAEVGLRVALVMLVFVAGASLGGYELACVGATAILLVYLVASPRARQAIASFADAGLAAMVRKNALAVVSTTSTAILVTAYGAVLKGFAHGADPLLLGGLILAVSLTRAPIMIPLTSFTGVAIKLFLKRRDAPFAAIAKPFWALIALGLVGGAAAWFVGPWFVGFFNPGYQIAGWVFAALTFSSAFMAVLTLLGTMVLALDAHVVYSAGWLVASAVALVILVTPIGLALRVVLSLSVGPMVGALVMVGWLAVYARRSRPSENVSG